MPDPVAALIERVRAWASSQPYVHALALVGSWARGAAREDSDVDLVIVAEATPPLLADLRWTNHFGSVLRTQVEDWGMVQSVRVWYANGPEVEFGVAPKEWAFLPLDAGTERVLRDGAIILHDPMGSLGAACEAIARTA
ncbi:MAG TPA: nucleotidyltransferase domain-containing protein [Anaerolineales bacterium]|nr:nucleotidyltransferase domain-containing protein [Anaerolineales bacterium]